MHRLLALLSTSALLLLSTHALFAQEKAPETPVTPTTPSTETTVPVPPEMPEPVTVPTPPTPPAAPEMTPAEKEAAEYRAIVGTVRVVPGAERSSLATVTPEAARATALEHYPGAEVDDVEFEEVNGYLFYEVEIEIGNREIELLIDAGSGVVVRTEIEDDD